MALITGPQNKYFSRIVFELEIWHGMFIRQILAELVLLKKRAGKLTGI